MSNRWSPSVKLLIVVILLLGTVWLLAQVHVIIAPIIIALLLAYLVSLPVGWILHRTGWRRGPVVLMTQAVVILLLLTIPALITPWAVNAFGAFGNTLVNVGQELLQVEPKPLVITSSLTHRSRTVLPADQSMAARRSWDRTRRPSKVSRGCWRRSPAAQP